MEVPQRQIRAANKHEAAPFDPLYLLPILISILTVIVVIIYIVLPDKRIKFCNITLPYRSWWRWLCCGMCCNLYCLPGIFLEGKIYQNFDRYQDQIQSLKLELADQREQREKSEKVFIQTCEYLKSEAESLKSTIERLQNKMEPSPGLSISKKAAELFQPQAQISMEFPNDIQTLPVVGGSRRIYIPISMEGQLSTRAKATAVGDPLKGALAAARFRRMLGGRLQRSGSVVWQ
jgi:hypothetical protein